MSVANKLLQAAAGGASDPVYVEDVFATHLYDGESSTSTTITINNGLDLSDKGGLLWTKSRGGAYGHYLIDSERGHGTGAILYSNLTNAATNSSFSTAFTSTGYTMKGGYDGFSQSSTSYGSPYVSWAFAKQEKFFDIVTYTGNGSNGGGSGRAIAHNLGCQPGMIIVKRTDNTGEWFTANLRADGAQYEFCRLNANNSKISNDLIANVANSTDVIVDGTSNGGGGSFANLYGGAQAINASGATYVMYLFGHNEQEFGEDSDEAIIKCAGYTGNGSTTGPTIDLGFEPQWVLIKRTSANGDWMLFDIMRGIPTGSDVAAVFPNSADAETLTDTWLEVNPTGFQLKHDHGRVNANSATYVYMAIARSHKPASEFAATDLFTLQAKSPGEGADTFISTGFNVDTVIYRSRATSATSLGDRLRGQSGGGDLLTNSTDIEGTNAGAFFLDHSNGVTVDYAGGHFNISPAATDKNYIRYFLRRAKGFFDVVTYIGSSSAQNVTHNLGAVPEMMIFKRRTAYAANWDVYHSAMGAEKALSINTDKSYLIATDSQFNNTAPTASVFTVGANYSTTNNNGQDYIAYLFASTSGISKVGSYTGTGNDITVDCGFSAGARFVLIKRWDRVGGSFGSNGDWYVYDSVRGIVAGDDPYIFLNTTATEVTNTDYIDPDNSGFIVTSSAPDALNASGGSYIFLAIA